MRRQRQRRRGPRVREPHAARRDRVDRRRQPAPHPVRAQRVDGDQQDVGPLGPASAAQARPRTGAAELRTEHDERQLLNVSIPSPEPSQGSTSTRRGSLGVRELGVGPWESDLLRPNRAERIDARGAARGQVAGEQSPPRTSAPRPARRRSAASVGDTRTARPASSRVATSATPTPSARPGESPGAPHRAGSSCAGSPRRCAPSAMRTPISGPLRDGIAHHAVDAEQRQRQRDAGKPLDHQHRSRRGARCSRSRSSIVRICQTGRSDRRVHGVADGADERHRIAVGRGSPAYMSP